MIYISNIIWKILFSYNSAIWEDHLKDHDIAAKKIALNNIEHTIFRDLV